MNHKKALTDEVELRERLWAKVRGLPMFPDWAKKRLAREFQFIGWRQAFGEGDLQFDHEKLKRLDLWLQQWEAGEITPDGAVKAKAKAKAVAGEVPQEVAPRDKVVKFQFDPQEFIKSLRAKDEREKKSTGEAASEPSPAAAPAAASEGVDLGALMMEARAAEAPPVRVRQKWEAVLPLYRTLRERGFNGRQAMDWLVKKGAVPKEGRSSAAGWLWWQERKGAQADAPR